MPILLYLILAKLFVTSAQKVPKATLKTIVLSIWLFTCRKPVFKSPCPLGAIEYNTSFNKLTDMKLMI